MTDIPESVIFLFWHAILCEGVASNEKTEDTGRKKSRAWKFSHALDM